MSAPPAQGEPVPQGDYVAVRRSGKLILTAGMTPRVAGRLMSFGPVRSGVPVEDYHEAVVLACSNALAAVRSALEPGEELEAILTMTVYVAGEAGFVDHSRLADAASAFLRQELGAAGIGSRTAVG